MKIRSFKIHNYKSWDDSGELTFQAGLNIIVGQNNAGKTTLLEALSLTKGHNPHISARSKPTRRTLLDTRANFACSFEFEKSEIIELLRYVTSDFFFVPFPDDSMTVNQAQSFAAERLSSQQQVTANFSDTTLVGSSLEPDWYSPSERFIKCKVDLSSRELILADPATIYKRKNVDQNTLSNHLVQQARQQIFLFRAERYNLGETSIQPNERLNPSCDNLAQVLHYLQAKNPVRFQRLSSLLKSVFPNIKAITIPPVGNKAQIRIWPIEPESERDDLSYPLSECGTGVGQVLAILYVVVSSDYPQCMLIDEPQSFLHPGAIRSLIEILQRNTQHQYIITTHSPVIVSTASSQIIHIQYDGAKSHARFFNREQTNDMRLLLEDMGSKLSDVFGSDSILWVEGATEEECFKLIVEKMETDPLWGIQIVGVRSTDELQGKHCELVCDIYQRLSNAGAIIPPSIGFIFDRENKSETQIKDLERRMNGKVRFLERRMFENYLLVPEAIVQLINSIPEFGITDLEVGTVKDMMRNAPPSDFRIEPFSESWYIQVHGARVLASIFQKLSRGLVPYRKVEHGYKLTKIILETESHKLSEVHELMKPFISKGRV